MSLNHIYKVKRTGPSTEPCGTLLLTLVGIHDRSDTISEKAGLNQVNAVRLIPMEHSYFVELIYRFCFKDFRQKSEVGNWSIII